METKRETDTRQRERERFTRENYGENEQAMEESKTYRRYVVERERDGWKQSQARKRETKKDVDAKGDSYAVRIHNQRHSPVSLLDFIHPTALRGFP